MLRMHVAPQAGIDRRRDRTAGRSPGGGGRESGRARPESLDAGGIDGRASGIVAATAPSPHGSLLTLVTAVAVAHCIVDGTLSSWLEPFLPSRFEGVPSSPAA